MPVSLWRRFEAPPAGRRCRMRAPPHPAPRRPHGPRPADVHHRQPAVSLRRHPASRPGGPPRVGGVGGELRPVPGALSRRRAPQRGLRLQRAELHLPAPPWRLTRQQRLDRRGPLRQRHLRRQGDADRRAPGRAGGQIGLLRRLGAPGDPSGRVRLALLPRPPRHHRARHRRRRERRSRRPAGHRGQHRQRERDVAAPALLDLPGQLQLGHRSVPVPPGGGRHGLQRRLHASLRGLRHRRRRLRARGLWRLRAHLRDVRWEAGVRRDRLHAPVSGQRHRQRGLLDR